MAALGMLLVDAPLGRTPAEAETGALDVMVGCAPEVFDQIRPVIAAWGGSINHIGPVGSAHRMKLVTNFIVMGYAALYSEALVMAVKSGLAPQDVARVIGSSRLTNGFFETFMIYAVGRDAKAHKFTIQNAAKDTRYIAGMPMAAGMANLMGSAIRDAFAQAEAAGKGGDYVPSLSDHVAALNGLDLSAAVAKG